MLAFHFPILDSWNLYNRFRIIWELRIFIYLFLQGERSTAIQCYGIHVYSSIVHWNYQWICCSTCCFYWKICVISRKSCRIILSCPICICSGLLDLLCSYFCAKIKNKNPLAIKEISSFYFLSLCRLLSSSPMYLLKQLFTVRFSTPWPHSSGLLWNLFGTYSLCILRCHTSLSTGWWLLLSHQITMCLPSLRLRFICSGTFLVASWFLIR